MRLLLAANNQATRRNEIIKSYLQLGLRRFSGPRIGSVGASCFADDFVSCWGKRGAWFGRCPSTSNPADGASRLDLSWIEGKHAEQTSLNWEQFRHHLGDDFALFAIREKGETSIFLSCVREFRYVISNVHLEFQAETELVFFDRRPVLGRSRCIETYSSTTSRSRPRTRGESIRG